MSEDQITKADAIASSLQPLAPAELARVASEKDQPRAALSVAANLAGGESLLWIGRPSERVIRGYWAFAAACMIGLTPLLYLAIEGSRGPLAIAGILLAPITFVHANMGLIGLKAFPAAVVGGFGSLPGAIVGGLIIGVVESLSGFYLPDGVKDTAAYIVVLVMLMVRPNGLFGEKLRKKV